MLQKKKIVEIGIVGVLFLCLAAYAEATESNINESSQVIRAGPGEHSRKLKLKVDAQGILEGYDYEVVIPAENVTDEEAKQYFAMAQQEIDNSFFAQGDNAEHVSQSVSMASSYVTHMVSAEWLLDSYEYVDMEGNIREENIQDHAIVQATVRLTCGKYEQEYCFSFQVIPLELSQEQKVLKSIEQAIATEADVEGKTYFQLPGKVNGIRLQWHEVKQHLVIKVFLFEMIIAVLLYFVAQERKQSLQKQRQEQMRLDYAEFVNKLLILLNSGMSLKQAMNRISAQYFDKRQKKREKGRFLYEELIIMNREIQDGESERQAYQKFAERTGLSCYQRLIRILIQNLQNGNRGLCDLLGQEVSVALEERKALARKLGEEAGTKMLIPLILMLGIVIAIIMVPAMQSFGV